MVEIPTGVLAFFFTDVVGSSGMWDADPVGMDMSLALHDEVVRTVMTNHGGHVFATGGDGFGATFRTPVAAVTAAIEIQQRLLAAEWAGPELFVRVGIHTGTAHERGGDYFGPTVNRTARICHAANGGQILVSAVTAELLGRDLPDGATLVDLGSHRLDSLEVSHHVFDLRHRDLEPVTEPIRTFDPPTHNLPRTRGSFVGRSDELRRLSVACESSDLVTLAGPGGTGKTRLAIEFGMTVIDQYPHGVCLIDLTPVDNPETVAAAFAEGLGLRSGEGSSARDVVLNHLSRQHMLVIVDNCEQVVEPVADLLLGVLEAHSKSQVLATSRVSLGIVGEAVIRVPSLDIPDDSDDSDSEAVVLFNDRARAVVPDFDPDPDDLGAIVRVCRRLDGIPLGLELAAARLRSLSPLELAERVDESLQIVASRTLGDPRHQTLTATIQWSYDLLADEERAVLGRLSVFRGGFTLDACEAVCAQGVLSEVDVVEHLDSLVDNSLVLSSPVGMRSRYRLLEPVRQFAEGRLQGSGRQHVALARHSEFYLNLVAEAAPHIRGPDQHAHDIRLAAEGPNIRLMLETLREAGRIEDHLSACFDLMWHWQHRGVQEEAIDLVLAGLEAEGPERPEMLTEIRAWFEAAMMGIDVMHPRATELARRGLELAVSSGDLNAIGKLEVALGACLTHHTGMTKFVGADHTNRGSELLAAHPNPPWWDPQWDDAYWNVMIGAYTPDDVCTDHLERAVALARSTRDQALTAFVLMASAFRDPDPLSILPDAIEIARSAGLKWVLGQSLYYYGAYARKTGDLDTARDVLTEAIPILADAGSHNSSTWAENLLCATEVARGDIHQANIHLARLAQSGFDRVELLSITAAMCAAAVEDLDGAAMFLGYADSNLVSSFLGETDVAFVEQRLMEGMRQDHLSFLRQRGAQLTPDELIDSINGWLDGREVS